jgi:hypothetical protein
MNNLQKTALVFLCPYLFFQKKFKPLPVLHLSPFYCGVDSTRNLGLLLIPLHFYIAMERNSTERPFALSHLTAFLPVPAQEEAAV